MIERISYEEAKRKLEDAAMEGVRERRKQSKQAAFNASFESSERMGDKELLKMREGPAPKVKYVDLATYNRRLRELGYREI